MRFKQIKKLIAEDELMEINMSPSSLKKLASQIDALAGMEFEMVVPNLSGVDDSDQEPDYDYDERCRSIEDAVQFFYDGDWNGRRDVERLREKMQNDFSEWLDDKIYQEWERHGEEYLEEWVPNNVDESEWNPEGLEGEERQEALEEFIANLHSNPGSSDAFDEYREENQESYDESDWLDDEDLDRMSSIENTYSMTWPHWRNVGNGEASIEDVANSFRDAVGRPILASTSYHSSRVERPSTKNLEYIVEPDSSINVDDESNEGGLEFVSPPLPIADMMSDLDKVKKWADRNGCYTNDSTGLHINVSVPGFDINKLDYVKLALLLGDNHILEVFGRTGNTYCKSAIEKVKSRVKQNPDTAEHLLNQMRNHMDQLATKAIHSGVTDKYTSINTKTGHIEFRSPGGDWLKKLDEGDEIQQTLLRFVVAMDAAMKPELYREEYLKKLYKLLDVTSNQDPLWYFVKYSAGGFSPTVLKSFIRQTQLERDVKRGKEKEKSQDDLTPFEIYNRDSNAVVSTVLARNAQEALAELDQFRAEQVRAQGITVDQATATYGIRHAPIPGSTIDLQRQRAAAASNTEPHPEGRGRPNDPTGRYAIVMRNDEAVHGRSGQAPNYQFRFNMSNLEQQGHGRYVLQAWAARNNVDPANYMIVDTTQYADANQIPTVDIDIEPAPQQPGMGEFNGQWRVVDGLGREVYRFGGVGNSQADANRIAATWARTTGFDGNIEVYPVMA
jgi:hypothetical protein